MRIALENCTALEGQFEPVLLPSVEALPASRLSSETPFDPARRRGSLGIGREGRSAALNTWAQQIKLGYLNHTSQTLGFGRTVHAAKLALRRGGWERIFREKDQYALPFGKTTGKKWDAIGDVCGAIGQAPDHLARLPGSFEALYQLSRLGIQLLRQAMEDGAVHAGLTEAGAREILQHYKPELKRKPRPFKLNAFLARTRTTVASLLADAAHRESRPALLAEFQQITAMIAEAIQTPAERHPSSKSRIHSPTIK